MNSSGSVAVRYSYDAWGNLISVKNASNQEITDESHVAIQNPIRYRGYVYDNEIELYYLQSRYYDASIGRFINADAPEMLLEDQGSLMQSNLYAYCANNPVMNVDNSGMLWGRAIIALASGAIFGGIAYAIGRTIGLKGKPLAALTAGFIAIGIVIGAWKGVGVLKSINKLIKPVIYFFSNPGKVKFGLKLLSIIQFEIHAPHHNKPIHFVIRLFLKTGQKVWEWWFKK